MPSPVPFASEDVYQPVEDTYLLLRAALAEARRRDLALEIGCGSGFISQELARRVRCLIATDINPHAVLAPGPGELRPSEQICSGVSKESST